MKNTVVVIDNNWTSIQIESEINQYLQKGWLIELYYEVKNQATGNKVIVTFYKED